MHVSLFLAAVAASQLTLAAASNVRRDDPSKGGGDDTSNGQPPTNPDIITAHPDGQCLKDLDKDKSGKDGNKQFIIAGHNLDKPLETQNPTFPGAEAKGGGGSNVASGYDVFFAMADPPPGCKNILMLPYHNNLARPKIRSGEKLVDGTIGKQVLQASKRGCFYAHIPQYTTLWMSRCCGPECDVASLTNGEPKTPKREVSVKREGIEAPAVGSSIAQAGAAVRRWLYEPDPPPGKACSFPQLLQGNTRAGPQTTLASHFSCDSPVSCTMSVTQGVSYSMTATSSDSQTVTTSNGVNVGMSVGFDLFAKTEFSVGSSMEWSNAVAHTSGQDTTQGNTTQITYTMPAIPGAEGAIISFIPDIVCYNGAVNCSSNPDSSWDNCFPVYDKQQKTIIGDFQMIYVA